MNINLATITHLATAAHAKPVNFSILSPMTLIDISQPLTWKTAVSRLRTVVTQNMHHKYSHTTDTVT